MRWIPLLLLFAAAAPSWAAPRKKPSPAAAGNAPLYRPATDAEISIAAARARDLRGKAVAATGVNLKELRTDHFLIFTDWDEQEYGFLRQNLEGAYRAVSEQFDLDAHDNIFVGRLPVFMLAEQKTFLTFAAAVDQMQVSEQMAGYYAGRTDGLGHLAMWKPPVGRDRAIRQAERNWAYVLCHELTHAFVARFRGDAIVPRWLNEGLADTVAAGKFPRPEAVATARHLARVEPSLAEVFDDQPKSGKWYPVMRSLVELLLERDREALLRYFIEVKGGADPQKALKKHFGLDYEELETAWRAKMK